MQIYLLRHGIAEDDRPGMPDADRALTEEGRKKLFRVLKTARSAGVRPDLVLTSPFKRAVETATIAAEALGCGEAPVPCPELTPGGEPEEVWSEIRNHRGCAQILLASHEPLTGYLAAYLVGGPQGMIHVKKGSIIRIDVEALGMRPRGILVWILTPKLAEAVE